MRTFKAFCLVSCIGLLLNNPAFAFVAGSGKTIAAKGTIQVAFVPWDNAEKLIINAIDQARQQILVQAFIFTSKKIAYALIRAKQRGLDVQVLADREQTETARNSVVPLIAASGIPVALEVNYQNAHNKIIIIDADLKSATLITGSYNWTHAAQHKNAENLLVFKGNLELIQAYIANWKRHHNTALSYKPK